MSDVIDINSARATLRDTDWTKRHDVAVAAGHRVYTHDCLPLSYFYVNHVAEVVVMGPDSYQALAADVRAFFQFLEELVHKDDGVSWIDLSRGEFAELLRSRAREAGVAAVIPRDILTDLSERTLALLWKAQGVREARIAQRALVPTQRSATTMDEMQLFDREQAKLNIEIRTVVGRVRHLESTLQLAIDAVLSV